MSIGKNQEAAQLRRGVKPPRSLCRRTAQSQDARRCFYGATRTAAFQSSAACLLFQLIPNAEFHLFDQCAHWVQWDQAERFNRLVSDFLAGER